jgi:TRAP-type mannitol/chloroaromatic compound transport system substrate-binding protein
MAKYDVQNPPALRRLAAGGAQLRVFPGEVLDAAFKAANDIYAEIGAQNADFRAMYEAQVAFRSEFCLYNQIAD